MMGFLRMIDALILCATLLITQRIIYPKAVGGIFARISTLFIISSIRFIFRSVGAEPFTTIAVVLVCTGCIAVGKRGDFLEGSVAVLECYLAAKALTWFGIIVAAFFVYPITGAVGYNAAMLIVRVIFHALALVAFAIGVRATNFKLDIRNHVKATVICTALLLIVSFCIVEQPFEAVGEQFFGYVLWVLFVSIGMLVAATILDNKDGKKERKLLTEHEQSEAGRIEAEAAHRAAVKVSHDIKEDLQKHLREYRMEAASDAAPELPGRVVAQTYRDMERRTSQELRDGKRLPRTGVSALDARLMKSLALAHGLDVDLDLMALAPIGGAVGRGVTADALAEAVGGVVDGAARAAAACDNPVRRVLLTVDMAGDLFPSIRIESTSAQFPEPDILKAVSQLLSPGGVSIEISADMLPGDIYEKAVHLLFDGEGRRVGSGLSETAAV